MIPFTQEIDTPGFSASLRPGAGRSQSGTSLNPSPRYSEASDFFSQKSVYVWIRIAQVAAHFYPRKRKRSSPHLRLHLSPFVFIGFGEVSPAGFIRSLNRRTDALGRRLNSFHANKLRSLACGTPHWGDASFVCPLPYRSWIRILAFHTNKSTTRKGWCLCLVSPAEFEPTTF